MTLCHQSKFHPGIRLVCAWGGWGGAAVLTDASHSPHTIGEDKAMHLFPIQGDTRGRGKAFVALKIGCLSTRQQGSYSNGWPAAATCQKRFKKSPSMTTHVTMGMGHEWLEN